LKIFGADVKIKTIDLANFDLLDFLRQVSPSERTSMGIQISLEPLLRFVSQSNRGDKQGLYLEQPTPREALSSMSENLFFEGIDRRASRREIA